MKDFLLGLLDWIYKKKCYFCKSSKECTIMCSKCYNTLNFNDTIPTREIMGTKIFTAGFYDKNLQKLIRGIKYHNQKDLAFYQAKFMAEYLDSLNLNKNFVIIPVPLHKNRQKKRKYNHMELVGEKLSELTGFEMNIQLIKRIKETKPQYKLNKKQRMENLANAFSAEAKAVDKNSELLLIDDISKTGSTFEEMIKELNKNGFYNITCLATAG